MTMAQIKKKYAVAALSVVLAAISCSRKEEVTLESLLDAMTDRTALTYYPETAWKQMQSSSYDRRSVSPDSMFWFANRDWTGYERLDTVGSRVEKVMMEWEGPGAIDRIWMTTKGKRGTMRFYFDGSDSASIVVPAYDMKRFPLDVPEALSLTHTHYESGIDGVGGNTFFLPIPFAESCRVTFEEETPDADFPRYFHINWRAYENGTKVKTFTLEDAERLLSKIKEVSSRLMNPETPEGEHIVKSVSLCPGDTLSICLPQGQESIRAIRVRTAGFADYGTAMEHLRISADFDGDRLVDAALSDFFGAGFGAPDVDGWWLSNHIGEAETRYVMPWRESACLLFVNEGETAVELCADVTVAPYGWTANSMYFHCGGHSEDGIPVDNRYDSNDNLDWNFITVAGGRGVYCGDLLCLYNHCVDWYGEGDEKIWVDDDNFPSHFGTGTEDYYNCSWAPVVPFLTPYGGAPRADELSSHGFNAYMRTRNLDVIPFSEKFRFDIEMLSWNPGTVDYHTLSWWYGDKETKMIIK